MIADALGVSDMTVETVRKELPNYAVEKRKGKDGKIRPAKMKRE
jgi:hypothetical protein